MDLGLVLGCARGRVNVRRAKVFGNLKRLADWERRKILVAEGHDLLLGDEECELIFASVGELGELNALDFSADVGGDIVHFCVLEEVGEAWVCVFAVLDFLEELIGRVLGVVPVRQVVGVSSRCVAFRAVQLNIIVGGLGALSECFLGVAVLQLVFLVDVGSFAVTCSIRQSFDKTWSHVCCRCMRVLLVTT